MHERGTGAGEKKKKGPRILCLGTEFVASAARQGFGARFL
jgi:hypothetical protein